jgi:hemerythrin-like domain-containing protein
VIGVSELRTELEREHHEIDAAFEVLAANDGAPAQAAVADTQNGIAVLRRHIYFEEVSLFPPLRAAGLFGPVTVMLREHAEMWPLLDALAVDLAADGNDAHRLARELLTLLADHNSKEETILYATADSDLPEAQVAALRADLDATAMPADWTCTALQPRA